MKETSAAAPRSTTLYFSILNISFDFAIGDYFVQPGGGLVTERVQKSGLLFHGSPFQRFFSL